MNKIMLVLGASILVLVTAQANAVIVGDKDWLQVTATNYVTWEEINDIFDTSTGECDVAGCILERAGEGPGLPSIDLTGYIWASNSEVNELFMVYSGGIGLDSLSENNMVYYPRGEMDDFFLDFEYTYTNGMDTAGAFGYTRNQSAGVPTTGDMMSAHTDGIQIEYDYPDYPPFPDDHIELNIDGCVGSIYYCTWEGSGGWFYSPVPVPAAVWLFGSGLIGLIGVARRKSA